MITGITEREMSTNVKNGKNGFGTVRYLSRAAVEALDINPASVLDPMRAGFEEKRLEPDVELPPKVGIHPRKDMMLHAGLAFLPKADIAGIKWLSGYPHNPRLHGLPYFSGVYVLNDSATGFPLCIMDATWLTETRTAVATAISLIAARPESAGTLAILGCGAQGARHASILSQVLPGLDRIRLFDPDRARAERLADTLGGIAEVAGTGRDALAGATAVVSAVPTVKPPPREYDGAEVDANAAIVALDYDAAWDAKLFERVSLYVVDDHRQYEHTRDDLGFFSGYGQPQAELAEVLAGVIPVPSDGITFFENLGFGLEDLVLAKIVYDAASAQDAGIVLEL